jgi:iron complex transport system permease protein
VASDTPSHEARIQQEWRTPSPPDINGTELYSRPVAAVALLAGSAAALIFCMLLSTSVGAADVPLGTVWKAVFSYDASNTDHIIIHEVRLPRVVAGVMVGVAFAVAGAIMQGMTRNPLASPSLMGLNAGSYFMITLGLVFLPWLTLNGLIWLSFTGAAMGTGIVYGIGSIAQGGLTPVKLALAGVAVSALLSALGEGLIVLHGEAFQLLLFFAGGVAGTNWGQVQILLPFLIFGLLGGMVLARNITVLSLGDDVARGLGQRTMLVKAAGSVVVVALAGSAVWVGGPIGFIGLIIPHVARFMVGLDYRWIIPASSMLGALMLVMADLGARMVNPPFETPVGIVTAAVGVPFFLYLARRDQRGM